MRTSASTYEFRDNGLFDSRNRCIAIARGQDIFDGSNRRIATMRGNDLFDSNYVKMMTISGTEIRDAEDRKVALVSDAAKLIKGGGTEMLAVAFWYCFVR